jgi:hypothetical protein
MFQTLVGQKRASGKTLETDFFKKFFTPYPAGTYALFGLHFTIRKFLSFRQFRASSRHRMESEWGLKTDEGEQRREGG